MPLPRPLGFALSVVIAVSVCACSATPTAPTSPPTAEELPALLARSFDSISIPANAACSLSVWQHGQVLFERGRGQIAPGRDAAADSAYRIGSVTKPITAAAVLVSERAGRMRRADKINQFIAYPEPAPTIDDLIKHAPGLPSYTDTAAYRAGYTTVTTVDNLLSLIPPWSGNRTYQYSNSHYVLLGAALDRANGRRYEDVVQRDIFGPAGMSRSSFLMPAASESISIPRSVTDSTWAYAAGAITSTAADVNLFNQAVLNNQFGFGDIATFFEISGPTSLGMHAARVNGEQVFTKDGAIDGYSSFSAIFPEDRSSVVILCNFETDHLYDVVMSRTDKGTGIRPAMLGR